MGCTPHQTKRVDALDADVEKLTRASAEAERRLGNGAAQRAPRRSRRPHPPRRRAIFSDVLARLMADGATIKTPQRIVVALDHLDALAPDRARSTLDTLHRLSGRGLMTIVAADPARLASGEP